jgi:hypothetical protein
MDALPTRAAPRFPPLLAAVGGAAIAAGACLPWMSYFAGLFPLRGLMGVNGRLMVLAGVIGLLTAAALTRRPASRARFVGRWAAGVLGCIVVIAAAWLLEGVRQLTRVHASNAMLAPRAGPGLVVVLVGGAMLLLAGAIPYRAAELSARD